MLKGANLQKQYDDRTILNGVSVAVEKGTITALLGSNGCGKSTLLRALALIEPDVDGEVDVDGDPYTSASAAGADPSPWPRVTMVFQQLFLWPHLTVRRNITLPQYATRTDDAAEQFDEVVRTFELEELLDLYPNQISLGQRQRVALARAMAVRPHYLLLDEVTSALDIEHITQLLAILKTLRESGIGILLVTHLIGFAREVASRILFMSRGVITEEGDAKVLSRPKTPELAHFLSMLESFEAPSAAAKEHTWR